MALGILARLPLALIIATALASRGRRKKSLSQSGAAAAFLVGFLSFLCSVRFGLTLLAFYLSSTRATRYRSDFKKLIEDGHSSETGNRSARQVLASSLPAVFIALIYLIRFKDDAPVSPHFVARSCLNLSFLLFFAACAGDTFSSEIGIAMPAYGKKPVLILAPWCIVPRGTNGGVTVEGTLASIFGGAVIGLTYFVVGPDYSVSQLWLVFVGALGGLVGSVVDSALGMLLQASWYDSASGRVLKDKPKVVANSHRHICGANLLSGEAVNTLSAIITCMLSPLFLPLFYRT